MLKNKTDKTCLLIDMTIPLDTNTSVKTTEKLNKKNQPKMAQKLHCVHAMETLTVYVGQENLIKEREENCKQGNN